MNKNVLMVMIFILCSLMGFSTCLAAPLGLICKEILQINSNAFGMIGNFLCFLPYFLFGYLAGNMLDKFGYKKAMIMAFLKGTSGILMQYLSCNELFLKILFTKNIPISIFIYFFWTFMSGMSNCFINTLFNPLINLLLGEGN